MRCDAARSMQLVCNRRGGVASRRIKSNNLVKLDEGEEAQLRVPAGGGERR